MHRKALFLGLFGVSAGALGAVGAGVRPTHVATVLPAAIQGVFVPASIPAPPPSPPAYSIDPVLAGAIAEWNRVRQSDNLPFSSYASFLLRHRGWPGETALRKTAEKAANPDSSSAADVVVFFDTFPPLTNVGQARFASALWARGRSDEAREAAREAWTGGSLPQGDEARLLGLFGGALTPADQDARMDMLLFTGDRPAAQRQLPLTSLAQRPLFEARLSLQANAPDAGTKLALLPPSAGADPGVLRDKANWLRRGGQALAARQVLAQRPQLASRPAGVEDWYETMLTLARESANDRQWTTAYDIASKLEDAYAPGTQVSDRSYGERDAYTSLAWIAGSAAMKLARYADAQRMFDLYGHAARSPQTRSKGFFWAARAANAGERRAEADSYLAQAATAPDQFYGQVAIEKLGRSVPPPPSTPTDPTPEERAAFLAKPLVQAVKALGLTGQRADQTLFVRAIAEQAKTDSERTLAAELGRQIGRPDLGVWVAREARNRGESFYARTSFPEVPVAPALSRYWTLAHAISRQESSFDRAAVSNAGARGMMQLMPGTARETAGKIGIGYDFSRLTNDPSYNVMLGTSYFSTLLDQWGGNVPLAVASYNAGTGNVRRWVAQNGDPRMPGTDVVRWIEDIPFSETRNYVQRVLENAVVYDTFGQGNGFGMNRMSHYLGKSSPDQIASSN